MRQLNLFTDYTPFSGIVIRLPIRVWGRREWHRRIVPATETLMARKTEKGRQNYWTAELNAIAARMRKHGADEDSIMGELDRFRNAVIQEMAKRKYGSRRGPGAA